MNVNLVAVNADGNDVWLDLYEEQPIKLTFNIEDIVTATPKAEFSRQFRLPATDANYNFFTTAFEINGVDFNPGIKYPARIVIDGSDFREGELRLRNVYRNDTKHRVDYECVFIGTAKSLATEIGEDTIGDLDWSDYTAPLTLSDIEDSWEAYPENVSLTAGLQDGNLLFPIIDFGNTYTGNATNQTRIAIGHPSSDGGSFDQSNHPLEYTRVRPMIRMREIMRRMFEDNGFSFTGTFLTDNVEVARMYVSAFGNSEEVDLNDGNANLAKTQRLTAQSFGGTQTGIINFNNIAFDPGSNITVAGTGNHLVYNIPANGNYQWRQYLNLAFVYNENSNTTQWTLFGNDPSTYVPLTSYRFTISQNGTGVCANLPIFRVEKNTGAGFTTIYDTNTGLGVDGGAQCTFNGFSPGDGFTPDQYIWYFSIGDDFTPVGLTTADSIIPYSVTSIPTGDPDNLMVIEPGSYLEITDAVGDFTVAPYFDENYKQIDLLKDVFTMFRLVMVPDPNNPTSFLIIPWNDYIGRGELKDWSSKLCLDKDIVIKPLLLDQPDKITFSMASDGDYYNTENEIIFDEVFGTRQLDSTYDILEGEREYKTKLAATPASQIEGFNTDWEDMLIPQLHTREVNNDGETLFKPIKPKTRMLYYNGTVTTNGDPFYMEDESNTTFTYTNFPLVSYSTQMPQLGPNNKSLLFERELSFDQSGTALSNFGQDLYGRYWSKYIDLLYNKDTRRVTAYFVLSADDILNFRYNDVIYVEGVYYYVEKIYDAPLGQKAKVKVDLITLKNYRPSVSIAPQPTNIIWENASSNWEAGYTNNWENV